MMNEEDRKRVFWLLKKYSSYTAWKALAEAYARFVDAYERAVEHYADADSGPVVEDRTEHDDEVQYTYEFHLKPILDSQIAFEKGIERLKLGDRNVFRDSSTGYLHNTYDVACRFIRRILDPEEYGLEWMVNRDQVLSTFRDYLNHTRVYAITEPDTTENVAPFRKADALDPEWQTATFPPNLERVPTPTEVLVNTGQEIPSSGIWEPEWASHTGLLEMISGRADSVERGCMNYLIRGAAAPQYQNSLQESARPVTWRLIWEDQRYKEGAIPEEEMEYLAERDLSAPEVNRIRALPTEVIPKTGLWWSPAIDGGKPRGFNQGDRFPDTATTDYGAVVWYFDPDKQQGS